jgi:hypothetical protein
MANGKISFRGTVTKVGAAKADWRLHTARIYARAIAAH